MGRRNRHRRNRSGHRGGSCGPIHLMTIVFLELEMVSCDYEDGFILLTWFVLDGIHPTVG